MTCSDSHCCLASDLAKPFYLSKNQVKVNCGRKCLEVQKAENVRLRQELGSRRRGLLQVLAWELAGEEYGQGSRVSTQNLYCLGILGAAVFSSIPDNQSTLDPYIMYPYPHLWGSGDAFCDLLRLKVWDFCLSFF